MELLREARPIIQRRIEEDIYRFRMLQLEPPQRDLLIAVANGADEPLSRDTIAALTPQLDPSSVTSAVQVLVDVGILDDRADRGEFYYTVPGFQDYLRAKGEGWLSNLD